MRRIFFVSTSIVSLIFSLAACTSPQVNSTKDARQPAGLFDLGKIFSGGELNPEARPLSDDEILSVSSSSQLKINSAKVLVDNDAAFNEKLKALRSAGEGDTIRLSYYIYATDHSSAVFYNELLNATKRGAKVKLFADLLTNYKYLDLFSYLESESHGAIQTRFFISLSSKLMRDFSFLTRPCPAVSGPKTATQCSNAKWQEIQNSPNPDLYQKLLVSGILAKSGGALKLAVTEGQQLDLEKLKNRGGSSKDEMAQLVEFLRLVVRAKLQKDDIAAVKVAMAYATYGEKLNPIMDQINGVIPIEQNGDTSYRDWEHLTDFTHHKFLMVGNRFLQVGGRNIENSYHTKPSSLTDRYVFKDVDAAVEIASGGGGVAKSFDEFWTFAPLTYSLDQVLKLAPNDFVTNPVAGGKAYVACAKGNYGPKRRAAVASCIAEQLPRQAEYQNREQRMRTLAGQLEANAAKYKEYDNSVKETWSSAGDLSGSLSERDVRRAMITYIENLHYDRRKSVEDRVRVFGSKPGEELNSGKNLHYLWFRSLENLCAVTAPSYKANPNQPRKRVILHSAYFLPPGMLMNTLAKMMNGTWDCRGVKVTILTNSMDTTDLNVINLIGRYQMTAFYYLYANRNEMFAEAIFKDNPAENPKFSGKNYSGRAALFDYFELKSATDKARVSMHAKVNIIGDDAMVTSANGDVRSYYMDTNNGLYLRNVPDFARDYVKWLDGIMRDKNQTQSPVAKFTAGGLTVDDAKDQLHHEDEKLVEYFFTKRNKMDKVEKHLPGLFKVMREATDMVYDSTLKIMQVNRNEGSTQPEQLRNQLELMEHFDRLLQLF